MRNKTLWLSLLAVVIIVLGTVGVSSLKTSPVSQVAHASPTPVANSDLDAIRQFAGNSSEGFSFVKNDLPLPYFRVGKVTQVGTGENMDPVAGWTRSVDIYQATKPIEGTCSVYEYHTDSRNHQLVAVIIRGLKPGEKNCTDKSNAMPTITKTEAETIATGYLSRAVPDYNQIKDQFVYSVERNGETHEWLRQDGNFELPEGVSSRPYPGPIIRISVYGNGEIQYWNTTSLFTQ